MLKWSVMEEELLERFIKKNYKKANQTGFRNENVIKKKKNKIYAK